MKRGLRGPAPKLFRPVPGLRLGVKEKTRTIPVPNKYPANDTYELYWKFGRYVCQLKRLTFNYCPNGGSSRGLRKFLDYEVDKFIDANPQTSVYIQQRCGREPRLIANYLNGNDRIVQVPNHDNQAISEWLERLKNESGRMWRRERLHQPWITNTPSIQGTWTPFTFKPHMNINYDNFLDKTEKEENA